MSNRGLLDLVISLLPGLKITDKIYLLQVFNKEEDMFVLSKKDVEGIIEHELTQFWDISEIFEKAGSIDTACRTRSIKWVSYTDEMYPPLLREIYDPPSVIYYKGTLPNPERSMLGMVGTRHPSPQAAEQAYKIAGNLSRLGISVISGLALGIDAMSHRGSLVGGASAYAVLGSGIDEIYPSVNRPLAKRILDSGGALISEYTPGTHPSKWSFPARNRIIAGLSRSVLIVEAPKKSGALITAGFTLEQGKDVWVASAGVESSAKFDKSGTLKLVEDGAEIIGSAKDVLDKWNIGNEEIADRNGLAFGENRGELISTIAGFLKIDI